MAENEETNEPAPTSVVGFTAEDLDALALIIAEQMATPASVGYDDPLVGYLGGPAPGQDVPLSGLTGLTDDRFVTKTIRISDVTQVLSNLSDTDKDYLAMEMLGAGVFDDINDMYGDDYQRDEKFFNKSVYDTILLAQRGTELGFDTTFLEILMNAGKGEDFNPLAIMQQIAERKAKQGGSGAGYTPYNSNALIRSLKDESSTTLGRVATKKEQRAFIRRIHNMQAAGQHISVPAEAEAFARQSDPNLAGAMDRYGAAEAVIRVLGMGGR